MRAHTGKFAMGLILALSLGGSAVAEDRRPPHTTLQVGGLRQKGDRGAYCWSYRNRGTCVDFFSYDWPPADRTKGDRRARIKVRKGYRPSRVDLRAYRHVDEDGNPTGDGWGLREKVRKHTIDGKTRWYIHFHIATKPGHYYLNLDTDLSDDTGARGDDVQYTFHLKLR